MQDLHQYVIQDRFTELKKALLVGMDPNQVLDEDCLTPLHMAVVFERLDAVQLLLCCGANPHLRCTASGENALTMAMLCKNKAIPYLLSALSYHEHSQIH